MLSRAFLTQNRPEANNAGSPRFLVKKATVGLEDLTQVNLEASAPNKMYLRRRATQKRVLGSEDCLFVNVWTPKERPKGKLLPALVFIHGGFLLYLSGNWRGLHPTPEMVVDMNIVGVSFNYRLNAFGFLA